MKEKLPLNGIIISIIDERGPYPKLWYPNFATLSQIHNSAVKSFSILVGDKSYREKSPRDLTCFSILPFPDINSIGFIHFSGFNEINEKKSSPRELPITITLLFDEAYRDELCQKSPKLYQFLEIGKLHNYYFELQDIISSEGYAPAFKFAMEHLTIHRGGGRYLCEKCLEKELAEEAKYPPDVACSI